MTAESKKGSWKGPTIREISEAAGVGLATVDRVLNGRDGVSHKTRDKVMRALETLSRNSDSGKHLSIRLFCDSGIAFNATMSTAEAVINQTVPDVSITGHYVESHAMEPHSFAAKMTEGGADADGVILIAPEHQVINCAVQTLTAKGIPVVCLTTDLPGSGRSAYIGNDQHAAGGIAAHLIGKALTPGRNRILMVMSVPFRCQQEREMGFRSVLRADFPHLQIEERVVSDDLYEHTYELVLKYLESHEAPAAIYNLAGANRGVAQALQDTGHVEDTLFVGHELTAFSQELLQQRQMDYVISHNFNAELNTAIQWIRQNIASESIAMPSNTQILIHTRFNC